MELQKVKIRRTFIGLPANTKIGSIVTIAKSLAVQAKDANKVEFIAEAPPPVTPEASAEAKPNVKEAKAEAKAEAAVEEKTDLKEPIDKSYQAHSKKKY